MKYFAIFGTAAVVLAGFTYYLIFSNPESASDAAGQADILETTNPEDTTKPQTPRTGISSLEALSLLGEDLECTISFTPEESSQKVEGTYFVSNGNIRGDFLTPSPDLGGQILSSIIINQPMMYVWSEIEGSLYGIKLDLTVSDATTMEKNQPISLQQDVDYNCKPWENVDRTVFVPPSTVLFQDMSELMKAGMEYGTIYEE
jgi:hypothetical protein